MSHDKLGKEVKKMDRIIFKSIIAFSICLLTAATWAATTDNHQVTLTVSAINEVAISGGNLSLTINSTTAGSDPDDAVDNTTCDLNWTTNEASKKITVATSLASQNFTLKVLAQNVTGGTAASEVTLSTTAADIVTGISTTKGTCDLQYTGSATAAQGTGTDTHTTVTYTLTAS
jgi:predicted secreted protein